MGDTETNRHRIEVFFIKRIIISVGKQAVECAQN